MIHKCEECGKVCKTARGLTIHRSYHLKQEDAPQGDPIEQPTPEARITDLQQLRDRRKLRILEENENLAIELENKRMREELSGISPQNQQEKKSDLDMFKQFIETQNTLTEASEKKEDKLRQRIMDSIAEGDLEPESTEDAMLKMLMSKIGDGSVPIMKKQDTPIPSPTNIHPTQNSLNEEEVLGSSSSVGFNKMDKQTIKDKTDKQIIDEIPDYVKTAIKSGGLTMEAVITGLKTQGQEVTPEEQKRLEKIYDKIKKQK